MVFGVYIDVPLIVGTFAVMFALRRRVARSLGRIKVPAPVLYILLSVVLIIVEEDVNCMPSWCGQVLIPPTLPFLLVEVAVLGMVAGLLRARSAFVPVLAYAVFGVAWELTVGGLKGAPPVVDLFFVPYVALSYAYVSMLPLEVLLKSRQPMSAGDSSPPAVG